MVDAVILVPEITKGMKSIGSKALLKISDSLCILEYQVQQLKKYHKKINIHIIAGFEIDKIKKILSKYKVNILYNDMYLSTNQARCLSIFLKEHTASGAFVISNGILFKNNPFDLVDTNKSKIFLIDKPKSNFNIGCCKNHKIDIDYLFYDLPVMWSECVYLNEKAVSEYLEISTYNNMEQLYLFEVINQLISQNISFEKSYISKKDIMKINTIKDISKAKLFI